MKGHMMGHVPFTLRSLGRPMDKGINGRMLIGCAGYRCPTGVRPRTPDWARPAQGPRSNISTRDISGAGLKDRLSPGGARGQDLLQVPNPI
jgi:hypothetical protein